MWHQFGKGWGARVNDLDLYAIALTKQPTAPSPVDKTPVPPVQPIPQASPKAVHPEPDPVIHATGTGATLSTAIAGHVAGVPMSYLVVFGLAVAATGVAYYFYQKYLAAKVNAVVVAAEKAVGPTGTTGASSAAAKK